MPWMVLARKRQPGYYDRWQVIAHLLEKDDAEACERDYAARSKRNTTIIETVGKPWSTVEGNGAEPALIWRIKSVS